MSAGRFERGPALLQSMTRQRGAEWLLAFVLLAVATWYVLWPLRSLERGWNDFAFIYTAGRSWLHGISPYDVERWRTEWVAVQPSFIVEPPTQPYMYPPHFALFAVPLALLPWTIAERCWDVINVAALIGTCVLSLRLLGAGRKPLWTPLTLTLVALACLNGAVRWCLVECQLALVPLLATVGAFWALHERRPNWLAVFAFLLALKPQIGLLPLTFLLLNGGHSGILRGAAAAVFVSVLAMAPTQLDNVVEQVARNYQLHMSIDFNRPDRFYSVSALFADGGQRSHWSFLSPLAGLLCVAVLTWLRRRGGCSREQALSPLWMAALTLALSVAFVPLHGYDLVVYIPLVLLAYRIRPWWLAAGIVALTLVASRFPDLTARLDLGPLAPYATLTIALAAAWAWWKARSRHSANAAPGDAPLARRRLELDTAAPAALNPSQDTPFHGSVSSVRA